MIKIDEYISNFLLPQSLIADKHPWDITTDLKELILHFIPMLDTDFEITDGIAIHKSVSIEQGAVLKAPLIIMEGAQISANAYFREGAIIGKNAKIGPGCEIKSSIVGNGSAIVHFNYIGNSIIGENVNFEAGAVAANHYNEQTDREIIVKYKDKLIKTKAIKFGALAGDGSKIGANAVLSPGTLLNRNTVVKRLQLIEQVKEFS